MFLSKFYVKLILAGRKSFNEVPANYKVEVKNLLEEKAAKGDFDAKKILGGVDNA